MRAGWEYKKLGEVCDVLNGLWTGKKGPFLNVAVIRNANFTKECTLNLSNVAYIDVEERQFKSRELKYGDIIIEKSGGSDKQPVGRPVLFDIQESGYSFSNFTATLRIKEESLLSSIFLHKVLLSQYNQGFTRRLQSKTTGLHNLDMKSYLKSIIPLPPIPQQRLIVSELDEINSLITLKREQLKKYDELAQSLFYEMFGDPVENEKGWEMKKLGEACSLKAGKAIKASELSEDYTYPCYGGNGVRGRINKVSHVDSAPIIGRQGAYCGTVNYAEAPFYATEHAVVVKPLRNLNVIWLFYTLVNLNLSRFAKGQAQPGIAVSSLTDGVNLPLPPLSLQQLFAQRIEQIEEQKKQVTAAIAQLETLLASRMQYWFE